uniref:W2 domain-containing protein n=1 Tax=Lactuca sativa TaxID=4236 RepID=A0A9R1W5T0_LACSA|nr:hypothetical protein LSAT_V11C300114230 [Lactuca sativa]
MCLESAKEYAPLFVQVLNILYDEDIIQEDVILEWANHKEHAADESDKIFVKQSQKFIQETVLKRLNEGGVKVKRNRRLRRAKA